MNQPTIVSPRGGRVNTKSRTFVQLTLIDHKAFDDSADKYVLTAELDVHDKGDVGRILSTLQRTVMSKLSEIGFFDRPDDNNVGVTEPLIGEPN